MEKEVNSLAVIDDSGIAGELTGKASHPYTSLPMATVEDRAKLYNITTDPDKRLRDFVGKTIEVAHVYAEQIEIKNDQTGEIQSAPRIILVDKNGVSYVSVSKGVFSAVKRLFQMFGTPDQWSKPLKVEVKQIAKGTNVTLTLSLIGQ